MFATVKLVMLDLQTCKLALLGIRLLYNATGGLDQITAQEVCSPHLNFWPIYIFTDSQGIDLLYIYSSFSYSGISLLTHRDGRMLDLSASKCFSPLITTQHNLVQWIDR